MLVDVVIIFSLLMITRNMFAHFLPKSQVFHAFVKFKTYVENLLSTKLKKAFQSDGSGEFMSHHFQNFWAQNDITYRISYPHTPEQNGVAKRIHRHIVEIGLTLLGQSHMPLCY